MTALDALLNIASSDSLSSYSFKYCLVDSKKHPLKLDGSFARPNHDEDFCNLSELADLSFEKLDSYAGIGVSVHASNVCAIDIDHCVSKCFDVNSIDFKARSIIDIFKDFAYIEFSFSGTGIRIFFKAAKVDSYEQTYYVKNSKLNIEYYYPEGSARYVTITGKSIIENDIKELNDEQQSTLLKFLNQYMLRPWKIDVSDNTTIVDDRSIDELMKKVRCKYLLDNVFQDLWFSNAPGSGHDESERDYHLVACLYESITKDKEKIRKLFEQSPFFKSKDWKHVNKWQKQNYRYFNYLYSKICSKGE